MVSSDSETSDNENHQSARQENIRLRNNSNLESNLNSTVVSNIMNEINDLIQQDTQNGMLHTSSYLITFLSVLFPSIILRIDDQFLFSIHLFELK